MNSKLNAVSAQNIPKVVFMALLIIAAVGTFFICERLVVAHGVANGHPTSIQPLPVNYGDYIAAAR